MDQFKTIKLLVLDVDGVLTDGKLYYTSEGESQKVFDVKDKFGIKLVSKFLTVCFMS
jgi:3-deoxy-D-manno-octulosonate 8-phosphate phosphatase (KDO 8-P phosphatase)